MVSFAKTKMNLATVEQSVDKNMQEKDKFFKEGVYDCVITEASDSKNPAKASNWKAITVVLEASGGKKAYLFIDIPLEDTDYIVNGRNMFFKFNEFRSFALGIGMQETDDMAEFINNKILNYDALKGIPVKVQMGWSRGHHAKWIKEGLFHLVDNKDIPVSVNGTPREFPNRDACEAYAKQNGMYYKGFVNPIGFIQPEPTKEPAKAVEPKAKKKVVDMPF